MLEGSKALLPHLPEQAAPFPRGWGVGGCPALRLSLSANPAPLGPVSLQVHPHGPGQATQAKEYINPHDSDDNDRVPWVLGHVVQLLISS